MLVVNSLSSVGDGGLSGLLASLSRLTNTIPGCTFSPAGASVTNLEGTHDLGVEPLRPLSGKEAVS
jgi:hypothetical protein